MSVNSDIAKYLRMGDLLNEKFIQSNEVRLMQLYLKALRSIRNELAEVYSKEGMIDPQTGKESIEYAKIRGRRLQELQARIEKELVGLKGTKEIIKEAVMKGHVIGYETTAFALERSLQTDLGFTLLNKAEQLAVLYNPMNKIKWSTRNLENIAQMTSSVRSTITQSIIEGKSFGEMSKRLTNELNIGASKAIRIVRTETGRSQQAGRQVAVDRSMDYAKELGMSVQKIWDASLDNRTRSNHGAMDGKEADAEGKFAFMTMKGEHKFVVGPKLTGTTDDINCRCEIRLQYNNIPLKVRKDNESKEVIPYKNYQDWKRAKL